MKLRSTIEFPPDVNGTCADAVAEWPNAYRDADEARRWGAIMERLTPGAVAMDLEVYCDDCRRWESLDAATCDGCHFDHCSAVLARNSETCGGAYLCDGCAEELKPAPSGERETAASLGVQCEGYAGVR